MTLTIPTPSGEWTLTLRAAAVYIDGPGYSGASLDVDDLYTYNAGRIPTAVLRAALDLLDDNTDKEG